MISRGVLLSTLFPSSFSLHHIFPDFLFQLHNLYTKLIYYMNMSKFSTNIDLQWSVVLYLRSYQYEWNVQLLVLTFTWTHMWVYKLTQYLCMLYNIYHALCTMYIFEVYTNIYCMCHSVRPITHNIIHILGVDVVEVSVSSWAAAVNEGIQVSSTKETMGNTTAR